MYAVTRRAIHRRWPPSARAPRAQAAALRTEEHSALRRFTARLNELEGAVAAERGKPNKEDTDWMEKTMALRNELETTQNIAQVGGGRGWRGGWERRG